MTRSWSPDDAGPSAVTVAVCAALVALGLLAASAHDQACRQAADGRPTAVAACAELRR